MAAVLVRRDPVAEEEQEVIAHDPAEWVLDQLGTPADLHRVDIKPLWGDYVRVNVFRNEEKRDKDAYGHDRVRREVTLSDSFFVLRTGAGFFAHPEVKRRYALHV